MDDIINLLSSIVSTMETISVVGLDNQDKFVGCANAIKTIMVRIEQTENESGRKKGDEVNGE